MRFVYHCLVGNLTPHCNRFKTPENTAETGLNLRFSKIRPTDSSEEAILSTALTRCFATRFVRCGRWPSRTVWAIV